MKYRFGFLTATFTILALAAVAVLLPIDGFAATPSLHAAGLLMTQPFSDPGALLTASIFGTWAYWHPVHKPSAAGQAPAVQFKVNATTPDCPNGIIDHSPAGGARLVAVEDCRTQCLASDDAALHDLANSLKAFYAFAPSLADTSLSDAQRFNVMSNTTYVHGIASWAGRMVGIFMDNKPDPSGKSMWIAGAPLTDHGSFDSAVTLDQLAGVLTDEMKRSALRL